MEKYGYDFEPELATEKTAADEASGVLQNVIGSEDLMDQQPQQEKGKGHDTGEH